MTIEQRFERGEVYEIRVRGVLDGRWSDWFEGLTVAPQAGGETLLSGPVADQAALHGVLDRVRALGLPLISVKQVKTEEESHVEKGGEGNGKTL